MKEKDLWERNSGFDSLKSRLNRDMQEEAIIPSSCMSQRIDVEVEEPETSENPDI